MERYDEYIFEYQRTNINRVECRGCRLSPIIASCGGTNINRVECRDVVTTFDSYMRLGTNINRVECRAV